MYKKIGRKPKIGDFFAQDKGFIDLVRILSVNKPGNVLCVDINRNIRFARRDELLTWTALPWVFEFDLKLEK